MSPPLQFDSECGLLSRTSFDDEVNADGEAQNNDLTEDPVRSLTNDKGKYEVQGLEYLGFVLSTRESLLLPSLEDLLILLMELAFPERMFI